MNYYWRTGNCCNDQRFPSGSLKKTNEPQGMTSISLTSTTRITISSRTSFTSATTICRPFCDPGGMSVTPTPITIEQAEPGVPSYKTGTVIRQPFCSQLEERLMLWLG